MRENGKRIAVLSAVIVAAAILGSTLIPTFAVGKDSPNPVSDPFMNMPGMSGMPPMQMALSGPSVVSTHSGDWSDPATWNGSLVAGYNVIIAPGTTVTYSEASSPPLKAIDVQGALVISTVASTQLTFTNMTVEYGGLLQVGSAATPVPSSVTTTLTLASPKEGASKIMVMGELEIHGTPVTPTWTRLAATVPAGATVLTLSQAVGWKAGDHVVVASTSLLGKETEEDWIMSASGNTVTLQYPLKYEHDGTAPTQAEVADLTRNVVVTSANDSVHATGVMFMPGAKGGISYAEFSHLGGKGVLGDYPIHFHHVQNTMDGTVINGVSVWDSHNRFITIHNSDGITIENSVGYKSIGHGFFLEDGTEENNTLLNNLAMLTLPGKIRPDDGGAAGFWIQNPRNNLTGNVAVSAAGSGFDLSIAEKAPLVIPFSQENFLASNNTVIIPRNLKIQAFVGNVAHSNRGDGIHLYRLNGMRHGAVSWFSGISMWRNGNMGVDITGAQFNVTSSLFFGNSNGNMRIDASDATVTQSKFYGEVTSSTSPNRIAISPFGIEVSGGRATISDSLFQGHLPKGTMASADIVNVPNGQGEAINVVNDQLLSWKQIAFGYPTNGWSYFNVVDLNGDSSQTYSLWRYDLQSTVAKSTVPVTAGLKQFLASCTTSTTFMALECPLVTATVWKSLHS